MVSDFLFRAAFSGFWIVFLANVAWVGRSKKWSAGRQTAPHARWLRVGALVFAVPYFVGTLLYALFPGWVAFLSIPLPDWFRLGIVGVAILGTSFFLWALWSLGENWAPSVSGVRKDTVLVTTGPYGIVRHPIYLGVFILLAALAALAANLLIVLPTLGLLILLYAQLPDEESLLISRFGDEYREYMKRTPRFIPNFRHELTA